MGKFDGILIMSDYDGTLSTREGRISAKNREAIEYFEREGGIFCISSGRQPNYIADLGKQVPLNGWCIAINGTVICTPDGKESIFKAPFKREIMVDFIKKVCKNCPERDHIRVVELEKTQHILPFEDEDKIIASMSGPFYKFLCVTPAEHSDEYLQKIGALAGKDFYVSRSWINGIEIQPSGTTKGDAIARLKELYGGKIHTVIAVGDYENDIEMIKKADIGYAVANAVPAVKAVADRHTVSCGDSAIAAIIAEL